MSKAFTREQIKRILRSPAVLEVNGNRIRYSEEFKIHLFGELSKGGKPGQVFREVGLPSELVGQKRIDRTAARVRQDETIAEYLNEYGDPWPSDGWGPTIPDDPWAAIMSMSYRINHLEQQIHRLEHVAQTLTAGAAKPDAGIGGVESDG